MLLCCVNVAEKWPHKGYPNEFVWRFYFTLLLSPLLLDAPFTFGAHDVASTRLEGLLTCMPLHHLHFESFYIVYNKQYTCT